MAERPTPSSPRSAWFASAPPSRVPRSRIFPTHAPSLRHGRRADERSGRWASACVDSNGGKRYVSRAPGSALACLAPGSKGVSASSRSVADDPYTRPSSRMRLLGTRKRETSAEGETACAAFASRLRSVRARMLFSREDEIPFLLPHDRNLDDGFLPRWPCGPWESLYLRRTRCTHAWFALLWRA